MAGERPRSEAKAPLVVGCGIGHKFFPLGLVWNSYCAGVHSGVLSCNRFVNNYLFDAIEMRWNSMIRWAGTEKCRSAPLGIWGSSLIVSCVFLSSGAAAHVIKGSLWKGAVMSVLSLYTIQSPCSEPEEWTSLGFPSFLCCISDGSGRTVFAALFLFGLVSSVCFRVQACTCSHGSCERDMIVALVLSILPPNQPPVSFSLWLLRFVCVLLCS